MDKEQQLERLLEQPYYVIDFLPRQVQKNEGHFFFEVEEYFFNDIELKSISEKFVHIILKTLCYFEFSIYYTVKPVSTVTSINRSPSQAAIFSGTKLTM